MMRVPQHRLCSALILLVMPASLLSGLSIAVGQEQALQRPQAIAVAPVATDPARKPV